MKFFIVGGAGFIGGHLVEALCAEGHLVTIFDRALKQNFWPGFKDVLIIEGDATTHTPDLSLLMRGHDVVVHLAANADIAKAAENPAIDFQDGTLVTHCVLEAMRVNGIKTLLYTSGSGVYGDRGSHACREDEVLQPISPYGASKAASEAMICAYAHMFGMRATAFRFANVVGAGQTHGVAYDFVRALRRDPSVLRVKGDGRQRKSYLHVSDAIDAMLLALVYRSTSLFAFDVFNVATPDTLSVHNIASMVIRALALKDVAIVFDGGARGWPGDVPVVRLESGAIRTIGWQPSLNSHQAMGSAIASLVSETA